MSSQEVKSPLLIVAGVHDEMSLGWSAAEAWLGGDPNNQLLVTTRSKKAGEFIAAKAEETDGRVSGIEIDWTEPAAARELYDALTRRVGSDRMVAGVVHSVAHAPPENFTTPSHQLSNEVYVKAFEATTLSFKGLVAGARDNLRPWAGAVTYGFSEYRRLTAEYGPALSIAKVALSHSVAELAGSLGREDPPARTAEIVTGFIPTYAGRGVLLGIRRQRGRPVTPEQMAEYVEEVSLLPADADEQRRNAGLIAVDFIANPMWSQTTGQRFEVNAGWSLSGKSIVPDEDR